MSDTESESDIEYNDTFLIFCNDKERISLDTSSDHYKLSLLINEHIISDEDDDDLKYGIKVPFDKNIILQVLEFLKLNKGIDPKICIEKTENGYKLNKEAKENYEFIMYISKNKENAYQFLWKIALCSIYMQVPSLHIICLARIIELKKFNGVFKIKCDDGEINLDLVNDFFKLSGFINDIFYEFLDSEDFNFEVDLKFKKKYVESILYFMKINQDIDPEISAKKGKDDNGITLDKLIIKYKKDENLEYIKKIFIENPTTIDDIKKKSFDLNCLHEVANYLSVPSIDKLIGAITNELFESLTVQDIRDIYGLVNDFTKEEYERFTDKKNYDDEEKFIVFEKDYADFMAHHDDFTPLKRMFRLFGDTLNDYKNVIMVDGSYKLFDPVTSKKYHDFFIVRFQYLLNIEGGYVNFKDEDKVLLQTIWDDWFNFRFNEDEYNMCDKYYTLKREINDQKDSEYMNRCHELFKLESFYDLSENQLSEINQVWSDWIKKNDDKVPPSDWNKFEALKKDEIKRLDGIRDVEFPKLYEEKLINVTDEKDGWNSNYFGWIWNDDENLYKKYIN